MSNIALDDLQQLRHGARVVGEYLAVFYRELRSAGVPRKVARKITYDKWALILRSQTGEIGEIGELRKMMKDFLEGISGDEPDDN